MTGRQNRPERATISRSEAGPPQGARPANARAPLAARLALIVVFASAIAVVAFLVMQDRIQIPGLRPDPSLPGSLLVISTRTPTPVLIHTPTRTRIVVARPTRRATHAPSPDAPLPSTPTTTPVLTLAADRDADLPRATRTAELPGAATPTPTAGTTTPTVPRSWRPTPLPAPILFEPAAGAAFGNKVRYKFTWYRRLQAHEKFSIYVRSARESGDFDWWAGEKEILHGGGAIYAVPGGYLYEVNSGLGGIPAGDAFWKVAVFDDRPGVKRPVSPWSEERGIVKK